MKNYLEFKRCLSRNDLWYKNELVDLAKRLDLSEIAAQIELRDLLRWWKEEVVEYVESIFTELSEYRNPLHPFAESKMYIAILTDVDDFMVPTLVAHSVLGAHVKFESLDGYKNWFEHSFKKCTLRVNQKEFDNISKLENVYLGHENKTLGGVKTCAVVCPRLHTPNVLKFAKLWSPKMSGVNG